MARSNSLPWERRKCTEDLLQVSRFLLMAPSILHLNHLNNCLLFVCFLTNRIVRKLFCGLSILLTDKSELLYNMVFDWINQFAAQQHPPVAVAWVRVMSDFEDATINAIHTHMPNVIVNGCYFHFGQCIERAVQRVGRQVNYNRQHSLFHIFVRKLRCLAFFPVHCVQEGYDDLIADSYNNVVAKLVAAGTPIGRIQDFIGYFTREWLPAGVTANWNVSNLEDHRTNNDMKVYSFIYTSYYSIKTLPILTLFM